MILLVGTTAPALEGLAQTLSAAGHPSRVATSLHESRELALVERPLILVVERSLAASFVSETIGIPLAPGGALVLFRNDQTATESLSPAVQRVVLADLALPLERHRLVALIQHVAERARAAGRTRRDASGDQLHV